MRGKRDHLQTGATTLDASEQRRSSREVCELLGITYRQLDKWVRNGWVPGQGPSRSGVPRYFTPEQVGRVTEIRDAIRSAQEVLEEAGLGSIVRLFSGQGRTAAERLRG